MFQYIFECIGTLQFAGAVLMLLIGFRHETQPLQVDVIRFFKERFLHTFHPGIGGPACVAHLIADAVAFIERFRPAGCGVDFIHVLFLPC